MKIEDLLVRVGSTNRQADGPLAAELRRSALNLSYEEEPMPDTNPEALDFRGASGLFAGLLAGTLTIGKERKA